MKVFTPIILIAICIGTYYMYIGPTYSEVKVLTAQRDSYNSILQKAKDLQSKRDDILAQYNSISPADIESLKKIIPDNFDSVLLVKHLSTIASNYGMVIGDVKITNQPTDNRQQVSTSQNTQYNTYYGSFSITGQYDQFVKFLKDLENGLYLVDVTSLSIKSDNKVLGSPLYDYNVEFHVYALN